MGMEKVVDVAVWVFGVSVRRECGSREAVGLWSPCGDALGLIARYELPASLFGTRYGGALVPHRHGSMCCCLGPRTKNIVRSGRGKVLREPMCAEGHAL